MLITLLYHRIGMPWSLSIKQFEKHLIYLKKKYTIAFPGEPVKKALCITFDDATADFYLNVFPLLKKHQIKVILAVASFYPLDQTDIPNQKRLGFREEDLFTPLSKEKGYYCTFTELKEMQNSSFVKIASHSHTHVNLLSNEIDLNQEMAFSKQVLEEKLSSSIDTFIYPYGKFNSKIKNQVKNHYTYQMRIGSGINIGGNDLFYRIPCDKIQNIEQIFSYKKIFIHMLNSIYNNIRNR